MLKVLIVEDETATRKGILNLMAWLELGVGETAEAADGASGLEMAARLLPDIIISDIRMPGMTGIEFVDALRARGVRSAVIFLSGYSDKEYLKAAIRLGAVRYVEKPVDPDELAEAIAAAAKACLAERETGPARGFAPLSGPQELYNRSVNQVIELIQTSYRDADLTVKTLADQVYLTPTYLSTLFKKVTGMTVFRYLTQYRIEQSKKLLAENGNKLLKIARSVGYKDAGRFAKTFKKLTGMMPSHFRRTVR